MKEINSREFNSITTKGKVVVDFFGVGCMNCRMLEPVLNDLAIYYPDIRFLKVNVDTNRDLVKRFNVTAFPALLFLQDGKQVSPVLFGFKPKSVIQRHLQNVYQ